MAWTIDSIAASIARFMAARERASSRRERRRTSAHRRDAPRSVAHALEELTRAWPGLEACAKRQNVELSATLERLPPVRCRPDDLRSLFRCVTSALLTLAHAGARLTWSGSFDGDDDEEAMITLCASLDSTKMDLAQLTDLFRPPAVAGVHGAAAPAENFWDDARRLVRQIGGRTSVLAHVDHSLAMGVSLPAAEDADEVVIRRVRPGETRRIDPPHASEEE